MNFDQKPAGSKSEPLKMRRFQSATAQNIQHAVALSFFDRRWWGHWANVTLSTTSAILTTLLSIPLIFHIAFCLGCVTVISTLAIKRYNYGQDETLRNQYYAFSRAGVKNPARSVRNNPELARNYDKAHKALTRYGRSRYVTPSGPNAKSDALEPLLNQKSIAQYCRLLLTGEISATSADALIVVVTEREITGLEEVTEAVNAMDGVATILVEGAL